ncbi:two-component system, NarL family, sensor histidine kinase DesK [Enterococcus sp. AZ194]|uniref:sensor histidine kinase n=1 Tax=Enterococcus sp. AZ194 TaxID=2774629 RepID=UPI003F290A6F
MKKFHLFPKGELLSSIVWQLFLIIPVVNLFPFDTFQKQFSFFLLIVFTVCYRNMLFQGEYFFYWLMVSYFISCFYMMELGYIYLFMFPAWQLGYSTLTKKRFLSVYFSQICLMSSSLIVGICLNANFDKEQLVLTLAFSLFTAFAPLSGREFFRQQEQRKQVYQANKRMEMIIKGEERNRIARELHDSLGQSLSVMTIKLELAQKLLEKQAVGTSNELKEIEGLSRSTLKTVREIVSDMRKRSIPEELIDSNMALTAAKIILITENETLCSLLTRSQQAEFSSVLRESITNIIRHSQATYCSINFLKVGTQLEISVRDNGIGPKNIIKGNGLSGIEERINSLHGVMAVYEQKGTVMSFLIPIQEETND